MNKEEKEAIYELEDIKFEERINKKIDIVLNLIKKQQKEIEELKDKNKTLEMLLQGNLFEMYNYYRELANSYQANCITKDKIKEKIEKIKEDEEFYRERDRMYEFNGKINILKELLGE